MATKVLSDWIFSLWFLLKLLQYCFCFVFWIFGHEACGILAPHILCIGRWSLSHWTTREVPQWLNFKKYWSNGLYHEWCWAQKKKKNQLEYSCSPKYACFCILVSISLLIFLDDPSPGQEEKGSCGTFFAFFTPENDVNEKEGWLRERALEQVHQLAIAPKKPPINVVAHNHYSVLIFFIYFLKAEV